MIKLCILFNLLMWTGIHAQDTIVHIFDVNPSTMTAVESIEITTSEEFSFQINKGVIVDGIALSVSPLNYERISGNDFDYLVFDSTNVKITMAAILPDSFFTVSEDGTYTMLLDFDYNYLDIKDVIEVDSSTNNFIYSIIHINDDYQVTDYKLDPDIERRRIDGNFLRFKGNH